VFGITGVWVMSLLLLSFDSSPDPSLFDRLATAAKPKPAVSDSVLRPTSYRLKSTDAAGRKVPPTAISVASAIDVAALPTCAKRREKDGCLVGWNEPNYVSNQATGLMHGIHSSHGATESGSLFASRAQIRVTTWIPVLAMTMTWEASCQETTRTSLPVVSSGAT